MVAMAVAVALAAAVAREAAMAATSSPVRENSKSRELCHSFGLQLVSRRTAPFSRTQRRMMCKQLTPWAFAAARTAGMRWTGCLLQAPHALHDGSAAHRPGARSPSRTPRLRRPPLPLPLCRKAGRGAGTETVALSLNASCRTLETKHRLDVTVSVCSDLGQILLLLLYHRA